MTHDWTPPTWGGSAGDDAERREQKRRKHEAEYLADLNGWHQDRGLKPLSMIEWRDRGRLAAVYQLHGANSQEGQDAMAAIRAIDGAPMMDNSPEASSRRMETMKDALDGVLHKPASGLPPGALGKQGVEPAGETQSGSERRQRSVTEGGPGDGLESAPVSQRGSRTRTGTQDSSAPACPKPLCQPPCPHREEEMLDAF